MGCHRHQELEDKLTSDVGDCWSNNFGCLSSTLKASNSSRFWSIMQPFQARSALRWKSIGALVYRLGMWMIWMEAFIAAFLPRPSPSAISICFPIMALATWRTCFIPTLYSPCHQTSSDSLMQNSDSQNWMHVTTCLALVAEHIPIGPNFWLHEEFLGFTEDFFLQDSLDSS